MKVTVHWQETCSYTSTVDVDETAVWQFLRDERDATGAVYPLSDHLSDGDVERYLSSGESNWFEQVNTETDYDATTDRQLLDIQNVDWRDDYERAADAREAAYDDKINAEVDERRAYEVPLRTYDHDARPDDDPEPGNRCKDCGEDIFWHGVDPEWMHCYDVANG